LEDVGKITQRLILMNGCLWYWLLLV